MCVSIEGGGGRVMVRDASGGGVKGVTLYCS